MHSIKNEQPNLPKHEKFEYWNEIVRNDAHNCKVAIFAKRRQIQNRFPALTQAAENIRDKSWL
jgi:hypothetical protein